MTSWYSSSYPWRNPAVNFPRFLLDVFWYVCNQLVLPKALIKKLKDLSRRFLRPGWNRVLAADLMAARLRESRSFFASAEDYFVIQGILVVMRRVEHYLNRPVPVAEYPAIVSEAIDIDEIEAQSRARDAGLTASEAVNAFTNIWLTGDHAQAHAFADRMLSYE